MPMATHKGARPHEKEVIKTCIDLALHSVDHGCIFIIDLGGKGGYYTKVYRSLGTEEGKPLSVLNERDKYIIKHLATMDGATIIDKNGSMREFGVTLKKHDTFFGHGKRHAFALGTSKLKGKICILASEEDRHVRIFRDGICVVDMDAKTHIPNSLRFKLVEFLEKPLPAALKSNGIKASVLDSPPIPAMAIITGGTVMLSEGFERLRYVL